MVEVSGGTVRVERNHGRREAAKVTVVGKNNKKKACDVKKGVKLLVPRACRQCCQVGYFTAISGRRRGLVGFERKRKICY